MQNAWMVNFCTNFRYIALKYRYYLLLYTIYIIFALGLEKISISLSSVTTPSPSVSMARKILTHMEKRSDL